MIKTTTALPADPRSPDPHAADVRHICGGGQAKLWN
jgi:hypothetical protein